MRNHLADFRVVLTALMALFLAGSMACVQELEPIDEEPTVDEINQTLQEVANRPSIDLTVDEAASFGSAGFDAAYGSDVAEVPDDTRPEPAREATYRIMALWGKIRPVDDAQPERLVWNPSLYVDSHDVIRVQRTLYFEDSDAIIPVDCLNCIVIESTTGRHVDGVVVDLYFDDSATPAFFEFNSPLVSVRYAADELADLNEVIYVDRAGNGLMLVALPLTEQPARRGILSGHWATVDSTDECSSEDDCWWVQGYFGGRWMSEDGELMGHLAGRFGHGIFFGKYIDTDGQFQGHLLGEYSDGHFRGEWYNESGNQVGVLHGRYTSEEGGGTGRFEGVWARLDITDPIDCTNPNSDGECPDPDEDCTNRRDDGTCPDPDEDCTNPYDDGSCPDSTEDRPDSDGDRTDDDPDSGDDDPTTSEGDRPDSGHSDDDPAGQSSDESSTDAASSDENSTDEDGTASTDGE